MEKTKAKKTRASEDSKFNQMLKLTLCIVNNGSQAQKDELERLFRNKLMEMTGEAI
jgi:hypothetical protein